MVDKLSICTRNPFLLYREEGAAGIGLDLSNKHAFNGQLAC